MLPAFLATDVVNLVAKPPVNASIAAIDIPLAKALLVILDIAASSSKIFLIPSLSNSNPAPLISSFKNSVKESPVSKAPEAPKIAPAIAPPLAVTPANGPPIAPAAAPVAAPVAAPTAPAANEPLLIIENIEDVKISGNTDGLFPTPFTKPKIPPPFSSFIF